MLLSGIEDVNSAMLRAGTAISPPAMTGLVTSVHVNEAARPAFMSPNHTKGFKG